MATPAAQVDRGDFDRDFWPLHDRCGAYSLNSPERMYGTWQAVRHIARRGIVGDVVECGVWRGGSAMLAAATLAAEGVRDRGVWLFDTYDGMSEPSEFDIDRTTGLRVADHWDQIKAMRGSAIVADASLDEVRANMASIDYPAAHVHFVKGLVEETLPDAGPQQVALLRLDTDWYRSTRHGLEHLWPRLSPGGVLIIGDYGRWAGARKAVDEYFADRDDAPLLSRLDVTARVGVKA